MIKDIGPIAVVGLGYVGLPVALALSSKFPGCVGFDVNKTRIKELKAGLDRTGEVDSETLKTTTLKFASEPSNLSGVKFFVITVPTPVDANRRPDLSYLISASEMVGAALSPGGVVVYESTVYPGVTEDICGPVLARVSGLKQRRDFKLGYSPERINPGDKEHSLERVIKVVSGEDAETLEQVAWVYSQIVQAGVFRASSIKVAEAAKVIENTQRDLNIALMNELSIIFDRLGIATHDVLEAARTKWNFLPFYPGLVGGHCIGVDPYYLTTKAEQLGLHPEVILAGRRINDEMGQYIAERTVKLMANAGLTIKGARVGVLGLTFKENVRDVRNSRVPDIVAELKEYALEVLVHDPLVDAEDASEEYSIGLSGYDALVNLDALVLAVPHRDFLEKPLDQLLGILRSGGVLVDVKGALLKQPLRKDIHYWAL